MYRINWYQNNCWLVLWMLELPDILWIDGKSLDCHSHTSYILGSLYVQTCTCQCYSSLFNPFRYRKVKLLNLVLGEKFLTFLFILVMWISSVVCALIRSLLCLLHLPSFRLVTVFLNVRASMFRSCQEQWARFCKSVIPCFVIIPIFFILLSSRVCLSGFWFGRLWVLLSWRCQTASVVTEVV